ncbi:MAG: patatin-like phospholipase family protein [Gammaproteobacteria bacterium]|jgi:NTE family protein|nr:patatin-like phospholipase family protein [Gammaproteobacteria bacterium]MDP6616687.1 patatin-like phospholipase family protein [Gammaproteobacteria bacterium]MDP6694716.1 patatin-like phospholipase family protein [Gammaproteobacteria bacterium]
MSKYQQQNSVSADHSIGLVLPGGGARGAYQVGVLKALAEMFPRRSANPFSVISGTSAGAINSVVLASRAQLFHVGVAELEHVWRNFKSTQVFRADTWTMLRNGTHWMLAVATGGLGRSNPTALLDNSPLRDLLKKRINFESIQRSIDRGFIDAVSVTAAGYSSARSVSFYQGSGPVHPWRRVRRSGREEKINVNHLMGSIAVPIVFPPVLIGQEYFGDGAMRQATPLSPAVHLGADRILVIGARNEVPDPEPVVEGNAQYPSLGRVAGYMLDALFMDGLSADLERLTRINLILDQLGEKTVEGDEGDLRTIEAFVMLPSEDIREIAERHVHEMPRSVRILLKGLGAMNKGGMQLASYLLFESGYTRELIRLGYRDAMHRKEELESFMRGEPLHAPGGIIGWRDLSQEYTARHKILKLSDQE